MQAGNIAKSGPHEVPLICDMAALRASHLISLQAGTRRRISTLVDCSSGVEHWQGCLHAAVKSRHCVPDSRSVATWPT